MKTIRHILLGLVLMGGIALMAGSAVVGCDDDRPATPDARPDARPPDGGPGGPDAGIPDFQAFTKELITTQTAENNEPADFIDRQFSDSEDPTFFDDLFP